MDSLITLTIIMIWCVAVVAVVAGVFLIRRINEIEKDVDELARDVGFIEFETNIRREK